MDWDNCYVTGETPWEKGIAHPELSRLLRNGSLSYPAGLEVLVPGCGLGHDVHELRDYGIQAQGLDISKPAVQQANSIFVHEGDFFSAETKDQYAELGGIWEHTCFCAISPVQRPDYVETIACLLKPGRELHGIFFINPDHDEPGPPYGVDLDELRTRFSSHFDWMEDFVPERTYEGREGRELYVRLRRK